MQHVGVGKTLSEPDYTETRSIPSDFREVVPPMFGEFTAAPMSEADIVGIDRQESRGDGECCVDERTGGLRARGMSEVRFMGTVVRSCEMNGLAT